MTDVEAVAQALFEAISAEGDGYHFYKMAARSTDDPKGQETFDLLAQEELDHKQFLTTQYHSVLQTGKPDRAVKLGQPAKLSGESPIFSDALKARLREAHYEMSALSIAIQLELNAINYYKTQAERASDPDLKGFFEELARWETGHYRALLAQQETFKEDYWAEGGFSPF